MSSIGKRFPTAKGTGNIRSIINKNKGKENTKNKRIYTSEQRSRFGEAFLPYANRLESVEDNRIKRKRRHKNKKKTTEEITNIPIYKDSDEKRQKQHEQKRNENKKNNEAKNTKLKEKEESNEDKLNWKGDVMTFDEGWPNLDQRRTLRIFNINLNGVTYHNELLEWEMTIAYLMDMQVDIFGCTEINLDMNNGITRDNIIQNGKHFDSYLRMATSSSLQKVGKTPFKMGGTITGANGCWSGRISTQGSDKLGRWSYVSLQARYGRLVTFITVYIPRKPSKEGGGTTIHQQMTADLLKYKGKLLDPREELLKDLHSFVKKRNK